MWNLRHDPNTRPARRRRGGNVVIEMAITFNVMLFLSFGMVEFGQYMYMKHCFESAARDAMRVAILASATQTQVNSVLTTTLAQANVTYAASMATITDLGPSTTGTVSDVATVPVGDLMQLTLSATYAQIPAAVRPLHSITGLGIGNTKTVVGECTMVKE